MSAKVLIVSGYGLNCEEETLHAYRHNSIDGKIIHINDLIDNPNVLSEFQILTIPGGFSYGDDTGAGNGFAQKMRLGLWHHLIKFMERDTLTMGICNGCQVLINLGFIPVISKEFGGRDISVTHNTNARYQCRWVDLKVSKDNTSPWLEGIDTLHVPVAHGEGRYIMTDEALAKIDPLIAMQYVKPDGSPANDEFPYNPNGSAKDIAGLTDYSGRILAMMPHPERGMFTWQRDDYHRLKDQAQRKGQELPDEADGMQLFQNAARYFGIKQSSKAA